MQEPRAPMFVKRGRERVLCMYVCYTGTRFQENSNRATWTRNVGPHHRARHEHQKLEKLYLRGAAGSWPMQAVLTRN